jgi:hypothetical protein
LLAIEAGQFSWLPQAGNDSRIVTGAGRSPAIPAVNL